MKVENGEEEVEFVGERFEKRYLEWMENMREWCICGEVWWGEGIGGWYDKERKEVQVGVEGGEDIEKWEEDNDVVDSWFS